MVEAGLVEEVQALLASGIPTTAQPFGAIGYRHVLELLDGQLAESDWVETLARDTRHFARRQLTWFRKHRAIRWLPFDGGGASNDIAPAVAHWLQHGGEGPGFATESEVVGPPSLAGRGRRG
jgi:tRNA dimethylallyltransferase